MRKGRIVFVLGGVRSGKSGFAVKFAEKLGGELVFIATATASDREMGERIEKHKKERGKEWRTIEKTRNIGEEIMKIENSTIIVECLTLLASNFMLASKTEKEIISEIEGIVDAAKKSGNTVIIVSNEVGRGIVPKNKLAREYTDILGRVNQLVAENSDEAHMLFAGIPIELKKLRKAIKWAF